MRHRNCTSGGIFSFDRYRFDETTATLRLFYSYDGGAAFEEVITFPAIGRDLAAVDRTAIDRACRLIFLMAGVSYYKAFVPDRLVCRAFPLDARTAAFVEKVYRNGLGEFAYRNGIDLRGKVNFAVDDTAPPQAVAPHLERTLCIPVGGGKDSVVSVECLKKSGVPLALFALSSPAGVAAPIQACMDAAGLPSIHVTRSLSPALFDLNAAGAYNGHVPITAILCAIAVAACLMQGWDTVVMSNEHSASAPNLKVHDLEVNHQYSKSFAFEQDFADYLSEHVVANFSCFSFLRPLSEAAITKRFAQMKTYHPIFRSCNTAFRQDARQRNENWCCDCPKCRFVFLALAPFLPKPEMISIFGRNMLDDPSQTEGFAALCGLGAHKPFECVGEEAESALLLQKAARMPPWEGDSVVRHLAPKLADAGFDENYAALFRLQTGHRVPLEYAGLLG